MKLKIFSLIVLLLTLNSCTRKIAQASRVQNLHHNGQQLYPYFQIKKSALGATIVGITLPALGYLYGFSAFHYKDDGTPYSIEERHAGATAIAAVGLGVSILAGIQFLFHDVGKAKNVKKSNFKKWLRKYNRRNNTNYVLALEDQNAIYLAPKNKKEEFLKEEILRQKQLAKDRKIQNEDNLKTLLGIVISVAAIMSQSKDNTNHKESWSLCPKCNGNKKILNEYREYDACPRCLGEGKIRD